MINVGWVKRSEPTRKRNKESTMFTQAKTQLSTVRDLLRFAVSRFNEAKLFFGHGTHNAYDEAAYLILHTLHLPLDTLEPFLDARLTSGELESRAAYAGTARHGAHSRRLPHARSLAGRFPLLRGRARDRAALLHCRAAAGATVALGGRSGNRHFRAGYVHRLGLPGDSDGARLPQCGNRRGRPVSGCARSRQTQRRGLRPGRSNSPDAVRSVRRSGGAKLRRDRQQPALCQRPIGASAAAGIPA